LANYDPVPQGCEIARSKNGVAGAVHCEIVLEDLSAAALDAIEPRRILPRRDTR
jgi:hypothetical protein